LKAIPVHHRGATAKPNLQAILASGQSRVAFASVKKANTGETALSGASKTSLAIFRFVRAYSNQSARSERSQQHGADEREYREHGQHIEPQGKVHVTSPVTVELD